MTTLRRHALATPFSTALRALLFLPLSRQGTVPRWPLLVLLVLNFASALLLSFQYDGGTIFNRYGIPDWLFLPLLLLLIGQWWDRRPNADSGWLMLGLMLACDMMLSWLYVAAWYLAKDSLSNHVLGVAGYVGFYAVNLWLGLAIGIAAVRGIGVVRWRGLLFALAVTGLVLVEVVALGDASSLLRPDYAAERASYIPPAAPRLAHEAAFYRESALLTRKLADIQPGKPGVPEVFSIIVAGDAEQGVFVREARSFDALFQQRFGTANHRIVLANHNSVTGKLPIASQTSLLAALKRIGAQMNRDEDVLVLYMTSHGSRTHDFVLDDAPLDLAPVTPAWLAQALRESGIQWKIVVVSACYSGGYIQPLRGDDTLVATAADATHTSFGCADENNFTYYGHALYQALQTQRDWLGAFEADRKSVV